MRLQGLVGVPQGSIPGPLLFNVSPPPGNNNVSDHNYSLCDKNKSVKCDYTCHNSTCDIQSRHCHVLRTLYLSHALQSVEKIHSDLTCSKFVNPSILYKA